MSNIDLENSGENQNPDCSLADILRAAENDDYEPNSKEDQLSTDPNDEGKPAKIKPSKLKSKPKKKSNAEDDSEEAEEEKPVRAPAKKAKGKKKPSKKGMAQIQGGGNQKN